MNQLNDASKMPFGKYKDKRLKHVPAQYIIWLACQFENGYWYDEQKKIRNYYELNKEILKKEQNDPCNDQVFVDLKVFLQKFWGGYWVS